MTYEFIIPEEEIYAMIHPESFERAFSNLIINSIKHSGPKTHVRLELLTVNNLIHIVLEDNGKGINPIYSEAIFDPFF